MMLPMTLSRRQLLAASAVAGCLPQLGADPLGLPIGCQVYPVRELIAKDFEGTLRQLAAIGYKTIEMCSPFGYQRDFAPLVSMKGSEMRKIIKGAGLACESSHFNFRELKENLDDRIAFAKDLGLKQMILASSGLRQDATMADWIRVAEELNKIGEKTQKAGIQAGFHNHTIEFKEIDGVLIYDKLMMTLDPKLVKMQFQVHVISV